MEGIMKPKVESIGLNTVKAKTSESKNELAVFVVSAFLTADSSLFEVGVSFNGWQVPDSKVVTDSPVDGLQTLGSGELMGLLGESQED